LLADVTGILVGTAVATMLIVLAIRWFWRRGLDLEEL
jgi:hypothetical protein